MAEPLIDGERDATGERAGAGGTAGGVGEVGDTSGVRGAIPGCGDGHYDSDLNCLMANATRSQDLRRIVVAHILQGAVA